MATSADYVYAMCQYIRGNPDCTFDTLIAVMNSQLGYSTNKATVWLNSFIEGSFVYFIIVANTFDAIKQRAIVTSEEGVSLLSAKIAEVMDLFLVGNQRYYKEGNVAYNIFNADEVNLNVLQGQINDLQDTIDGLHEFKTVPDQETLNFWNDSMFNVEEEKQDLLQEKTEKQSLLDYLSGL